MFIFSYRVSSMGLEIHRLGVCLYPKSILSVEFSRDRKLFVWRVEFDATSSSTDHLVIGLKERFPEYLGCVSAGQLTRLVRFAATARDLNKLGDEELDRVKRGMQDRFERNQISKADKEFVYDYQIDFEGQGTSRSFSDDEL